MEKAKSTLKRKLIIAGIALLVIQLGLMGCMAILVGGQMMFFMPTAEVGIIEEYKLVGEATKVNWAEMLIYDTVRYENDFTEADPKETVYNFLIIEFERREKEYYCVEKDEKGNCIKEEYKWVTVEKSILHGKEKILGKLKQLGYENLDFYSTMEKYNQLNNDESLIIVFSGKDLEDLMDDFTPEQIEWANMLIEENFIFEMYGYVFDLPEHIPVAGGKFAWPTPTLHNVTSPYGWRTHPVTGERKFHYGVDIAGPNAMGQPIISVADGIVFQVNYTNNAAGYNVRIKHIDEDGNEWQSRYCHMSHIGVKAGQQVKQGDVIGAVGNTGRSTGPHLHFELKFCGQLVDPYPYINRKGVRE